MLPSGLLALALASLSAITPRPSLAQESAAAAAKRAISADARVAVVEAVLANLEADYIYEERGRELAGALRQRMRAGSYDDIAEPVAFGEALTRDLLADSDDRHLRVWYQPSRDAPRPGRRREADPGYGFRAVERLDGNIGYIDLRGFAGSEAAKPTADAVLRYLDGVDALIIDLRRNSGGGPWMVRYLSAFLFAERTHLVSTWMRGMESPAERWTADDLGVAPRPDMPVYLLTSNRTFSAAESFAFGLFTNGRVTLVGERTGGGGHFGGVAPLPHGFQMFVPIGRTYDPRTDEGWEATGIRPHVEVAADDVLERAHELALGATIERRPEQPMIGAWSGPLESDSDSERITLRVRGDGSKRLSGTLVFHRAQREVSLDTVESEGPLLRCDYLSANTALELRLSADGRVLEGTYDQDGETLAVRLERR